MKYKLQAYSIFEYGQRKDALGNPHQEDCIYPAHGTATDRDRLFILCDGMGGHDAGEVASQTVCHAMSEAVIATCPDTEGPFTADDLAGALNAAFGALDECDTGAEKKMGTTMTFLKLFDKGCCIAHMGDSRVYHIRQGKTCDDTSILFRTEDHSLVNDLVRIGELTEEEARTSNKKNIITRAMQPHMERRPKADVKWISDIRAGDYFYMCSDGMLENMTDKQIRFNFSKEAGDDKKRVEILTRATGTNKDNHSAIIVHILEVSDSTPSKPAGKAPQAARAITSPRGWLMGIIVVLATFICFLLWHGRQDTNATAPEVAPQDSPAESNVASTRANTTTDIVNAVKNIATSDKKDSLNI